MTPSRNQTETKSEPRGRSINQGCEGGANCAERDVRSKARTYTRVGHVRGWKAHIKRARSYGWVVIRSEGLKEHLSVQLIKEEKEHLIHSGARDREKELIAWRTSYKTEESNKQL